MVASAARSESSVATRGERRTRSRKSLTSLCAASCTPRRTCSRIDGFSRCQQVSYKIPDALFDLAHGMITSPEGSPAATSSGWLPVPAELPTASPARARLREVARTRPPRPSPQGRLPGRSRAYATGGQSREPRCQPLVTRGGCRRRRLGLPPQTLADRRTIPAPRAFRILFQLGSRPAFGFGFFFAADSHLAAKA